MSENYARTDRYNRLFDIFIETINLSQQQKHMLSPPVRNEKFVNQGKILHHFFNDTGVQRNREEQSFE